jgi:hypothetical protein
MRYPATIAFALALSLLFPAMAMAADPVKPGNPLRETYPLYGKVVSINARTLVIKGGKGKPDRTFALSPSLAIKKDEKPATLSDVVTGQWVGGSVRKTANGPPILEKLNLSVKQKP